MKRRQHQATAFSDLKSELSSQRFRQFPPERAFIEWYVRARYGTGTNYQVTDGAKDGGIDAIATERPVRVAIQSKYEPSTKLRTVSRSELAAFEAMAARFRTPEGDPSFESWLRSVRPNLHSTYRELRRVALSEPVNLRFDFVTSKRVTGVVDSEFNIVDADRIAPLWLLYEEGFTPPVESVSIEFEDVWSTGSSGDEFRNYVGLVDVRVFLSLMDKDRNERLFAQNVRTNLRTTINKGIRATYETEPNTFWLGNNGIYIVCSRASVEGRTLRVIYPSIINGSQTLHSIYDSPKRHSCRILVRVLVLDTVGQRPMLNSIIRRTNTQNPMKPVNLAAHDPEQLNIARFLDGLEVFYERREKEWQNEKKALLHGYISVNIKELAQWVAVTFGGFGAGTARARVSSLFLDGNYQRLFGRFGAALNSDSYRRLASAVFAGLVVKRFLRKLPKSRRREKIAHLLLTQAVFECVESSAPLKSGVGEYIRYRRFSVGSSGRFSRSVTPFLKDLLSSQKRAQKSDMSLDLSNYFKRDGYTTAAFRKAASRARLKSMTTALQKELGV